MAAAEHLIAALAEDMADDGGLVLSRSGSARSAVAELALTAACLRRFLIVDIVADLSRVDDVTATSLEGLCELQLAAAVAVCVGGVEEGDSELVVRDLATGASTLVPTPYAVPEDCRI